MSKKIIALTLLLMLLLSSCGLYDKEITVISDYIVDYKPAASSGEKITVENAEQLAKAVVTIVQHFPDTNTIIFSSEYRGNPHDDIAAACKTVSVQNPLCVYCVESISYELYQVPAYYEAKLNVSYADSAENIKNIVRVSYSGSLKAIISSALNEGCTRKVVLVDKSSYSEDYVSNLVEEIYYSNPLSLPCEPQISVRMFSGTGKDRLYEILIDYGVSEEQFETFRNEASSFNMTEFDPDNLSEAKKTMLAVAYLLSRCRVSDSNSMNTAYDAIFCGEANCKGLSLALNAVCKSLNVDCRMVAGQRDWKDYYWNIVKLDDDYYHIDMERCISEGIIDGFLLNDEKIWQTYRWNLSTYPQCQGKIIYDLEDFNNYLALCSENS